VGIQDSELFKQQCYIDGQWITSAESFDVVDPSTQQPVGHVPSLGEEEILAAIASAHTAFPLWKNLTAKERSNLLRRWHNLILEHQSDLAAIMTREQGKPLEEAMREVASCASYVDGMQRKRNGSMATRFRCPRRANASSS